MKSLIGFGIVMGLLLSGCTSQWQTKPTINPPPEPVVTISVLPSMEVQLPETAHLQVTTQNDLSGNRFVAGSIDLRVATRLDIPLDGTPQWLVSAPYQNSVFFVAVMDNGAAKAFRVTGQEYEELTINSSHLPAGMPPLLTISKDGPHLVVPPADASSLTNPILVKNELVYIASNGDLVAVNGSSQSRLPINALPDARILKDEEDRLLLFAQPVTRYDHGILGDTLEASAIILVDTEPELKVLQTISIPAPDVIEGISAIWADMDNDGERDIIVTLSNNRTGSRIAVYHEDGALLAESDPIGVGHRWRHQIAAARFGMDHPPLLVSIRTPHIGGIVEFLRYRDGKLEIVKEIPGFSTHSIGSRNLDSALAGDFNGDGMIELLLPDQSHTSLGVVSLSGILVTLPLDDTLTTNISATNLNGKLYIGAGMPGRIRIWVP